MHARTLTQWSITSRAVLVVVAPGVVVKASMVAVTVARTLVVAVAMAMAVVVMVVRTPAAAAAVQVEVLVEVAVVAVLVLVLVLAAAVAWRPGKLAKGCLSKRAAWHGQFEMR